MKVPPKAYHGLSSSYVQLLAVSLAEKLALRIVAVMEWAEDTQVTAAVLAQILRQLNKEGVTGDTASEVLIAVVNKMPMPLKIET